MSRSRYAAAWPAQMHSAVGEGCVTFDKDAKAVSFDRARAIQGDMQIYPRPLLWLNRVPLPSS
ncbi:MAG: hypothetical protein ABI843_12265 [Dokdonella sp.]